MEDVAVAQIGVDHRTTGDGDRQRHHRAVREYGTRMEVNRRGAAASRSCEGTSQPCLPVILANAGIWSDHPRSQRWCDRMQDIDGMDAACAGCTLWPSLTSAACINMLDNAGQLEYIVDGTLIGQEKSRVCLLGIVVGHAADIVTHDSSSFLL